LMPDVQVSFHYFFLWFICLVGLIVIGRILLKETSLDL
jgi:hypothetical protein